MVSYRESTTGLKVVHPPSRWTTLIRTTISHLSILSIIIVQFSLFSVTIRRSSGEGGGGDSDLRSLNIVANSCTSILKRVVVIHRMLTPFLLTYPSNTISLFIMCVVCTTCFLSSLYFHYHYRSLFWYLDLPLLLKSPRSLYKINQSEEWSVLSKVL